MPEQIDISTLLTRASINIDPEESPDARVGRLQRESAQHRFEIVKGYVLLFGVLAGIALVGGLCAYEGIFDPSASADTKRWAQTTLSALFTGSITFLLGQKTAKKA
ncbi:MAG: hypothetical protein JO216_08225 [Hyphomicrobiales bacterium]|nr:hypothetical protein [Hyphomicrobiales bacterium]